MRSMRRFWCAVACVAGVLGLPGTASATPTARIAAPAAGSTWAAGEPIDVAGEAFASNGSRLRSSRSHWTLTCPSCAAKSVAELNGSSGTFTPPDSARPQRLVLTLTATDYDGRTAAESVTLQPQTSVVEL